MYLKFESFISYSSTEAIKNPLNDFSKKLEDIIADNKFISDTDINLDFSFRRQFLSDSISIYVYFKITKLFSIRLQLKNNDVIIKFTKYNNWYNIETSVIEDIFDVIKDSSTLIDKEHSKYSIPMNKVYNLIENVEIYKLSTKYNL